MLRIKILLLFAIFWSLGLKGQMNLDSLRKAALNQVSAESKLDGYLGLSAQWSVQNQDSAYFYIEKSLKLSEKVKDKTYRIEALNQWANYLQRKSLSDSALQIYNQTLILAKELNYLKGLAKLTNNISLIYTERGEYPRALDYFFESLGYEDQLGNESGKAEVYNNIGVIFYYQQDYDKSLEYIKLALDIHKTIGNTLGLKQTYNNIGGINQMLGRLDTAVLYYQKSLDLALELNDENEIANGYNNLAGIYKEKGDFKVAESYYHKGIALNKALNNYSSLATANINIALLYQKQNLDAKALHFFNVALSLTHEYGFKALRAEVYKRLQTFYELQGDYKKSLRYSNNLRALEDTIFNQTKSEAIADAEARYESAKKDQALAEQEAQLAKEQLRHRKKNQWIILLVSFLTIILIVAIFVYRQQKLKEARMKSEALLKQERAKAELRERMEAERLRISRDLHDHIGTQLTIIGSNIDQLAFQEREEGKRNLLEDISDHSRDTMHQLRETIWAMNVDGINMKMLVAKLQEFFRRANSPDKSMHIDNNCDGELVLSPNQTIALFRICQEAANNAIKYAHFQSFRIKIATVVDTLQVEISDDGKGMDLAEKERGYGLSNMQQRAKDIGASFKIESALGQGCRIYITLKLDASLSEVSVL
tara:strand:- start:11209 stop:13167 length:1959 start_codon:yes stop_codon:yes gene_type:complete